MLHVCCYVDVCLSFEWIGGIVDCAITSLTNKQFNNLI